MPSDASSSNGPAKRRIGRRGIAAFMGLAGVFLLASNALSTRDALDAHEAQIATKRRATESQLAGTNAQLPAVSSKDQAKLDKLQQRLWTVLIGAALALLMALVMAMTDVEPRWLGGGLALVGAIVWGVTGNVAPVLPFFVAVGVAQVPDRIWNPHDS